MGQVSLLCIRVASALTKRQEEETECKKRNRSEKRSLVLLSLTELLMVRYYFLSGGPIFLPVLRSSTQVVFSFLCRAAPSDSLFSLKHR